MIATQVPNSQAPIYLPMIVKGTPNLDGGVPTETEATLIVTIDTNDYTLKSEFYNGVAFFDIAPLINEHFANTLVDVGTPTGKIYSDRNLYVPYTLDGGDGWTETGNFVGVNAIAGQSGFLTGFTKPKTTYGYPFSLSFTSFGDNTVTVSDYDELELTYTANGLVESTLISFIAPINFISRDSFLFEVKQGGGGIVATFEISTETNLCTPASPFYVRWINRFGGYDYWMFEKRQITNSELDGVETFNQYTELGTFEKQINSKAKETITVGAENITNADYNEVYQLAYSPRIEHWNGTSWDALVIDKMKAEFDSGETRQAVEFTFNLPTRQMQW